jgi:hypothetical protein
VGEGACLTYELDCVLDVVSLVVITTIIAVIIIIA